MNIKKLFTKMSEEDKAKDREQKKYHNLISEKAKEISLSVVKRNLKMKQINELEQLYKNYHKAFPDPSGEIKAEQRINKLKSFAT